MSNTDDRPALYDFITKIVDDVHELRPDMTRTEVENAVGPACADMILQCTDMTLNAVARELVETFDHGPETSALVGEIAGFVRNSLERSD